MPHRAGPKLWESFQPPTPPPVPGGNSHWVWPRCREGPAHGGSLAEVPGERFSHVGRVWSFGVPFGARPCLRLCFPGAAEPLGILQGTQSS